MVGFSPGRSSLATCCCETLARFATRVARGGARPLPRLGYRGDRLSMSLGYTGAKLPAPLQREGDRGVEQLETVVGHEVRSSGDVVVLEEELYP